MLGEAAVFRRSFDNAVSLGAGKRAGFVAGARKQKILRSGSGTVASIGVQRLTQNCVNGNRSVFPGFLLGDTDMLSQNAIRMTYILPLQF